MSGKLSSNTISIQSILDAVNNLPNGAINGGGIDTSDATATSNEIFEGETAYVNGSKITGTFTIEDELATQDSLIAQISSVVNELPDAGGGSSSAETCTVTLTFDSNCAESPSFAGEGSSILISYLDTDGFNQMIYNISFSEPLQITNVLRNSLLIVSTSLCDYDDQITYEFAGEQGGEQGYVALKSNPDTIFYLISENNNIYARY